LNAVTSDDGDIYRGRPDLEGIICEFVKLLQYPFLTELLFPDHLEIEQCFETDTIILPTTAGSDMSVEDHARKWNCGNNLTQHLPFEDIWTGV